MRLIATGASVTGPAHLQDNQPNQDAMLVHGINKGWCISVCDGLGSRKLSHLGSKKAAQLVRHSLRYRNNTGVMDICQSIRRSWLADFGNDHRNYETTCLWGLVSPQGRGMAAQTGDGLLLVKSNGAFQILAECRAGFGNQTTTLAQAVEERWSIKEFQLQLPGDGVLLMTDGISDDLIEEQLESFFDVIYQQLAKTNKRRMRQWLIKELEGWSTPRHGDDKSIAGIFCSE